MSSESSMSAVAAADAVAVDAAAASLGQSGKTLQDYMADIERNKQLIEGQQKIISSQIAQGEEILKTLNSSVSLTNPCAPAPKPAAVAARANANANAAPAAITSLNKLEEEERKKRKEGDWVSTPKIWKGDWEKRKREHDEKVKKAQDDIHAYETFLSERDEAEIKALDEEYMSKVRSWNQPKDYAEYKVLRKAHDKAKEFIETDVIPRAALDKQFAEQREARKKVLSIFDTSFNALNEQKLQLTNQIKEIVGQEKKFLTMSNEEKERNSEYATLKSKKENFNNQKKDIEKKITELKAKKDEDLVPIDKAISELKATAKKKDIGGDAVAVARKTRRKRVKNAKRRQSRKL